MGRLQEAGTWLCAASTAASVGLTPLCLYRGAHLHVDKAVLGYSVGDFSLWGTERGWERKGRAVATEQHCARLAACKSQGLSGDKHIH